MDLLIEKPAVQLVQNAEIGELSRKHLDPAL
jgi:hypothetical protein